MGRDFFLSTFGARAMNNVISVHRATCMKINKLIKRDDLKNNGNCRWRIEITCSCAHILTRISPSQTLMTLIGGYIMACPIHSYHVSDFIERLGSRVHNEMENF
jgi:hypothetical protein